MKTPSHAFRCGFKASMLARLLLAGIISVLGLLAVLCLDDGGTAPPRAGDGPHWHSESELNGDPR